MLNVSRYRSDALVLSAGRLQIIPLPAATPQAVGAQAIEFSRALATAMDPTAGPYQQGQAEGKLLEILDWLWQAVAGPVADAITRAEAAPQGPRQRLWWVATGLLSLLPLHSAAQRSQAGTRPTQAVTSLSSLHMRRPYERLD